ncbi:hypothetical protein K7G98_25815, partial [Saccharothrix sp. MB29]|nr:hypothetical protein [Saccharothrix sp. MB29]
MSNAFDSNPSNRNIRETSVLTRLGDLCHIFGTPAAEPNGVISGRESNRFDSHTWTFDEFDERERCAVDPLPVG